MPTPPHPLAPGLGDAFTVAQALAVGHTASRLRARDLDKPYRGARRVVTPPAPAAPHDAPLARDRAERERVVRAARAYRPVMPPGAVFVGRTAAVLWGLPCAHGDELHVGVFAPRHGVRRPGIRGVKLSPRLVGTCTLERMPVADPASTWAMLGAELSVRQLIVLGDAVVRIPRDQRGHPQPAQQLCTVAGLRAAAEAPRRRHRDRLSTALDGIRVGAMSPLETDFRLVTVAAGLPEPDLDVEIRDERGYLIGIADAVYPRERVIVEVEGDHHRVSRTQWQRDIEKHAAYGAAGWRVVRLTSAHISGPHPLAPALLRAALGA
ncbi:endonuclease domain-containing protein [Microbacterium sp. W1N]|uniref:endonuclease domain-containing protein n=1 Tax=Microbacterium festucae TaxID=2977531 RepID=UPI0021BFC672|nr:endonuclease domain-containing protein [Microbacterium festucae]MCT9820591.1 endonuclease domain-containing protein [Microbacterium festucae]